MINFFSNRIAVLKFTFFFTFLKTISPKKKPGMCPVSELRVAGFRLIPYFPRNRSSIPVVPDVPDEDLEDTADNPEDVKYFESLDSPTPSYERLSLPSL